MPARVPAVALAVLSAVLSAASCVPSSLGGRPVLLTDSHMYEWLRRRNVAAEPLARAVRLRVADSPAEAEEALHRALRGRILPGPAPTVILAAALLPDLPALAREHPEVGFVLLEAAGGPAGSGTPAGPFPPNVQEIHFDRREAFRRAGRAAAASLPDGPAAGGPLRAAVLHLHASPRDLEEAEAFREGLAAARPSAELLRRDIAGPDEREELRRIMEELRGLGVRLFLLKAYTLNPSGLENLVRQGGLAVVEDWAASGFGSQAVLLSIERDLAGALRLALEWDRRRRSGGPAGSGAAAPLEGPVEVVPGGALSLLEPAARETVRGELVPPVRPEE